MKIKLESSNYVFKTNVVKYILKNKIKKNLDINIDKFEYNPGVNSIKLLHLYFTRWTVAFTSAQKIQFNNCLYKPKLQVSDL